jgi:hypothetical protein
MSARIEPCPECAVDVAVCDNNVRLNVPAEPFDRDPLGACWTIATAGPVALAVVGPEPPHGQGHRLHEHQPEETS